MNKFTFKSVLLLFSMSLFFTQVNAMPAYPKLVQFTQPNGSKINIYLKGDENVKWAETTDGYSIVFNKNGYYEYAKLDKMNEMVPSGIIAKEVKNRSKNEKIFLKSIQKKLRYSRDQVHLMKKINNIYELEKSRAFPTTGTRKLICVLIGFTDKSFTKTQADFNNLFNQVGYATSGATGSVKDFFNESSYGLFNLSVTVAGPYTAANNMAYYGANDANGNDMHPEILAKEAVTLANASVNFADFDNDNDGTVDGVYIIYAGYGEEAGASANAIWAHAWSFPAITLDGKSVSRYSCSSEFMGTSGTTMTRIGVICHEFGHVLGAPDFYDTDYSTGGQYEGTGEWDLQAGGSWNNNGATPAHPNAYTKCYIYNWATPTTISTAQAITMQNSTTNSGSFYRYNTTTSNEYYLLENRQKTGFNAYVPAHGMVVYHVDGTYVAAHDNSNDINNTSHQGMYIVPANQSSANGIATSSSSTMNSTGSTFPGTSSKTTFSDTTTPNSKSWAGANTAKPLLNIVESAGVISFDFISAAASPSLTLSKTALTGFTYFYGSGPSTSQSYTVSGANLSGYPGNVTVTGPKNYEVSLNNSTFATSVNIPYTSATLTATTVYVRLKAGLSIASYNSSVISNSGGGASSTSVTCSGSVVAQPTLTLGQTTLEDFTYVYGQGPSASKSYSVRGSNLTGYPGNITITAPSNYEVSTNNSTFSSSVSVAYSSATLNTTNIYVRLKAGLAVNSYINSNITNSGGGANSLTVTCNGNVTKAKILFDASKAETAANADWVIDEDTFTLLYSSNGTVSTGGSEGTAQRFPTPSQTLVNSSTPETYWTGGLSSFGIDIVKQGYGVETLPWNGSITYGNSSNAQDLSNYDVFVMCEPNIMLTASEKTAILNFVNDGGGLYMLADHGGATPADRNNDGYSSIDVFNDLMAGNIFGMSFDNVDYSYNTTNILNSSTDPLLHGSAGNVGEHEVHGSTTITLNKTSNLSVTGVIYKSGYSTTGTLGCNVAYATYGKGRVVGMGDSSPAEDPTGDPNDVTYDGWLQPTTGLNTGDNGTLITNATIWLANSKKLTVSTASLSGFSYTYGNGPSAVQSFTISGSNLTGSSMTISCASNYEISLSSTTGFASSLNISYTAPTLSSKTIYVRLKAGLAINSYNNLIVANIGGGISANVTCSGDVVGVPTLNLGSSNLTGFSYIDGNGPSTSQSYTIDGSYLTGYPGNIVISIARAYEISTDNISFSTSLNIPYTSSTLNTKTIYVRLKTGLTVNTYDNIISNVGGGASASMNCSGEVLTTPAITLSYTSLSDFSYILGNGPSDSQIFSIRGTSLIGAPNNVSISAPINYEISLNNTSFSSSLLIPYTSASLASTSIYVRLKQGLPINVYNNELISISAPSANNVSVSCSGFVSNVPSSTVCGTETFDLSTLNSTYANGSFVGNNDVTWTYVSSRNEYTYPINGNGIMLRSNLYSSNIISSTISGGIGSFTCSLKKAFTAAGNRQVELFVNGVSKGTSIAWDNTTTQTFTVDNINISGNVNIEIRNITSYQVIVDDISWTCYSTVPVSPTLTVSNASLTGFTYISGSGPSTSQTFNLNGTNLIGTPGNITVTAPNGYEVSLNNSTFSSSVMVSYTQATLSSTPIYVRLKAGLSVNSYNNALISISGGNASTITVSCSGNVADASLITECGNETFDNSALTTSYVNDSFVGNNNVTWTYVSSRNEYTFGINGKGIMLRSSAYSSNIVSSTISGGIGSFTCSLKKAFTAAGNRQVELFINGISQGTSIAWDNTTTQTFTVENINIAGDVVIELRNITTFQVTVDDISWTCYSSGAVSPILAVTPSTLSGFSYISGSGTSNSQMYELSGSNLIGAPGNISITAPTNYEISLNNSTFTTSLAVPYSSAILSAIPVYVRLKAGLAVNSYNNFNVTNSGGGATTVNVTCSGDVTSAGSACGNETFDNSALTTSYANSSFTGNNGVVWTYVASRNEDVYGIIGKGIMLRSSAYFSAISSSTISGGIGTFTCNLKKGFTGTGNRQVELFINGVSKGTSVVWDNVEVQKFSVENINISSDITIEIRNISAYQVIVDDISWTCYSDVAVSPVLSVNNDFLVDYNYISGSGPSASQVFNLSGTNLIGAPGNITVSSPANYEVSLNNSTFSTSVSIPYNNSTLAATPIYARLMAGLSVAAYTELISISGGSATTIEVLCDGTVTNASSACGSETFDSSALTASYLSSSFVGNNGITWTYVASRNEDVYGINGKGIMLRSSAYFSNLTSSTVSGGIGSFSCNLRKGFTGAGNRQVELFVNGISQGTSIAWDNVDIQNFTVNNINISGDVVIEIKNITTYQVIVDDISWTCYSVAKNKTDNSTSKFEPKFNIYPNPNNGTFKFDFDRNISKISIMDIAGKIIYTNSIIESNEIKINVNPGIYFIQIETENNRYTKKLIFQ